MDNHGLSVGDGRLRSGGSASRKRKKKGNSEADMISSFCDVVIHHILSFLPVRDAAKTCILSKRWRKVWASAPVIDFDQKYFLEKRRAALASPAADALANFMSGAILCREQTPLKLLQISLAYSSLYFYPVRLWMQMAMKLNIQEMHLDFSGREIFLQHRSSYSADPCLPYYCDNGGYHYSAAVSHSDSESSSDESDSVHEVDPASNKSDNSNSGDALHSSRFVVFPSILSYGFLRVLHLTGCNISYGGPMRFSSLALLVLRDVNISCILLHKMLSCCSVLEKLELRNIVGLKRLKLSTPKLLSLKLDCCHSLKKVTIVAEALQTFRFGLSHNIKELALHFPALIKAEVGLCNMKPPVDIILKLLNGLGHVNDLTLYSRLFQDMAIPMGQMKNFTMSNVKRFGMIGKMNEAAVSTIFGFLKVFTSLESLQLFFVHPSQPRKTDDHVFKKIQSTSLKSHLKEVKIHGFEGNEVDIRLVEFFLDNAKVLKNIDIKTYTPSFQSHGEINRRLSGRRNSQDLKLSYS